MAANFLAQHLVPRLLRVCLLALGVCGFAAAEAQSALLTFEGLSQNQPVGAFYSAQGITFSANATALTSSAAFNIPSPPTIAYWPTGAGIVVDVSSGYVALSLYYINGGDPGSLTAYSGANGTGTVVGTVPLPVTAGYGDWLQVGPALSATARSFVVNGTAGFLAIDNVSLTLATAPSVTTLAAGSVSFSSAMLNASVNPNGLATTGFFRYGTDPTLTAGTTTAGQALGSGTSAGPVSQAVSGLLPHALYYFRASATNSLGTTSDGILSFNTLDRAPVANDDFFPAPVTAPPFTFDVLANDSDPDGDARTITAVTNGAHGTVTTDGATVAYTPGGGYHGNDTFTYTISDGFGMTATASVTIFLAPDVVTGAATSVLPTAAVLHGTVNPRDLSTDVAFEIATNPAMTGAVTTSSQNIGSGFADVVVTFPVTGLVPNTTYYYRVAATSSAGTARGEVHSFLTPVIAWGGAGANAGEGILDATRIPADTFTPVPAPVVFTNVAGQGYDISTTTYRLGATGPATFPATTEGNPAWFFQGTAPNNSGYAAFTFRFFQTGTTNPTGVLGIHLRLEDAETNERFANFSYWDAIGNKITVPFTDSLFTYSNPPSYFNNGYGVVNGAGYEGGTQTGKWIDIDLSLRAISGFELLSHRQTSSAGSVVMTGWGGGPLPMNVWRQAQFGASWTVDSISGDFADPNGDSIINLLAYAFGIAPLGPTSGGLPVVGLSGGYLTITFTRPLSVTDLTYRVEVSADMLTWLPGSTYASSGDVPSNANSTQLSRTVGATTETIVVRDNIPVGSGSRYIRVRVTRP